MALSDTNPTERERWLGPYRLLEELGRGANGVVYLADREGQKVALKVLLPTGIDDPEAVVRFKLEADIARKLNDPGVVGVYDAGREGNNYYFAMEYCPGPTLRTRLKHGTPLETLETCRMLAQLARTVAYAHELGVLHRDLKPANIILDSTQDGFPRITDFGLARDRSLLRSLTETGTVMGTPLYMSPEQLRGEKDVDGRTDAYSLGVILYRCLTGQPPHQAESRIDLTKKVLYEDVLPPSRAVKDIPAWLDEVCLLALAKDRDARSTAAELAGDLEAGIRMGRAPQRSSVRGSRALVSARKRSPKSFPVALSGALVGVGLLAAAVIVFSSSGTDAGSATPGPGVSSAPTNPVADLSAEVDRLLKEARAHAALASSAAWSETLTEARRLVAGDAELEARVATEAETVARTMFAECEPLLHREERFDASLAAALEAVGEQAEDSELRGRALWEQMDYLRRRARYSKALIPARALASDPVWGARARQVYAHLLYKIGGLDSAWDAFREAWLSDRTGAAGLTALAERDLGCQNPEEALLLAEAALAQDPRFAPALAIRARARYRLGDPVPGAEVVKAGPSDDPDLLLAAFEGERNTAYLDMARLLTEGRDPDVLYVSGQIYNAREDPQRAVKALLQAYEARPDARSLILRGVILVEDLRDTEAAIADFKRAARFDPDGFSLALEEIVQGPGAEQVREWAGLSRESVWNVRAPVAPSPAGLERIEQLVAGVGAEARESLALALRDASEGSLAWPQVEERFRAAEPSASQDGLAALALARLYMGRDHPEGARRLAARARDLRAPPAAVDLIEAETLLRTGERTQALTRYEELAARSPESVEGLTATAEAHLLRGDPAAAAVAAMQALQLDDSYLPALVTAVRSQLDSAPQEARHLARRITRLYGSLDSRALYMRSAADGRKYVKPDGMLLLWQSEVHRRSFRRAKRYAQGACWTSVGANACVLIIRDTLSMINSRELQTALAMMGGQGKGMMSYLVVALRMLHNVAAEREPNRAELFHAAGSLSADPRERERYWRQAQRLDPNLEMDELYQQAAERVDAWFGPDAPR